MEFTKHEKTILDALRDILTETDMVFTADLIWKDPKTLRGALASLIKKDVLYVSVDYPSNINGTDYYPVVWWDEKVLEQVA